MRSVLVLVEVELNAEGEVAKLHMSEGGPWAGSATPQTFEEDDDTGAGEWRDASNAEALLAEHVVSEALRLASGELPVRGELYDGQLTFGDVPVPVEVMDFVNGGRSTPQELLDEGYAPESIRATEGGQSNAYVLRRWEAKR